jgi:prevent-host-death family protein
MIRTLRESKAKLSELVESASRGQDVLITVRGKVKARLTRAVATGNIANRAAWVRQLKKIQKAYGARKSPTTEEILAELRSERL